MDIEKLKIENEHLKEELKRNSEMLQIRMSRIFQLVDELEESNTKCGKLQGIIDEATAAIDEALSLDEADEIYSKLCEIKETLEA